MIVYYALHILIVGLFVADKLLNSVEESKLLGRSHGLRRKRDRLGSPRSQSRLKSGDLLLEGRFGVGNFVSLHR